jgi:hypothetical protein
MLSNSFKVLQPDDADDEDNFENELEVCNIRAVQNEKGVMKGKGQDMVNLGVGEIVVDSAADESCWPQGMGDAFKTEPSRRKLVLKTANGSEMQHYGEKKISFTHEGNNEGVVGLTFQVTDVGRPLLAVRRLVEEGCAVHFGDKPEDNYILDPSRARIPMIKKGGNFVIRCHFVMPGFPRPA